MLQYTLSDGWTFGLRTRTPAEWHLLLDVTWSCTVAVSSLVDIALRGSTDLVCVAAVRFPISLDWMPCSRQSLILRIDDCTKQVQACILTVFRFLPQRRVQKHRNAYSTAISVKVKSSTRCSSSYSGPEALYNFGSDSWLAWANYAAAQYAAIHCPPERTIGSAVCR